MSAFQHISLQEPLAALKPITLAEMEAIKLMNRIDSKYLTNEATLVKVLSDAAAAGYRALEAEGEKLSPYSSIYYDTDALRMFSDHHNRRLVRQKVRTRTYLKSGIAFLEIKRKNNKGRTSKKRIAIPKEQLSDFRGNAEACDYLARKSWFTADELSPVLETAFSRITLVNPDRTERLTIDTCLEFRNFRTGLSASLRDAVIIELKQDGRAGSLMKGILLDRRVLPARVSKYCVAVTLTDPAARSGRFKVKVRRIEKIINHKITIQ
ncbi:MAG: polyphosphate polymerase domain-containing protein [Bacteroidales bacterium]|nr:polyphosphate polymerase domain-containing protein [Bacteroidales bacterium]